VADPDYFTLAELRALPDCSGSTFTDAQINAAAAHFVDIVEREVGFPMISRTLVESYDGGRYEIFLRSPLVVSVTSATENGTTVTDTLRVTPSGILTRYASASTFTPKAWLPGYGNVTVTYVAGKTACPDDVKGAVMWATRDRLLSQTDQSGIDVRRTTVNNDFGTTTYVLPGEKRPTGFPELDAIIASHKRVSPTLVF
jgi:hypothetical protein